MSRMTRREIAAAFAQGNRGNGSGALSSEGRIAYSYDEPIAMWMGDPGASECLVSTLRYTMTTSHHLGAIRTALAIAGKRMRETTHDHLKATIAASLPWWHDVDPLVDPCSICGATAYTVADNYPRCPIHVEAQQPTKASRAASPHDVTHHRSMEHDQR